MKYLVLFLTALFAVFTCIQAKVIELTDTNFDDLVTEKDEWLIDFYADWCGYCKRLEPKFYAADRLLSMSSYSHTKTGTVNVQTNPGLAARFFISRLPTIVHIKDHEVREVERKKSENDIVSFVALEEWRDVKPKSSIISPFSLFGKTVGFVGKSIKKLSGYSPWAMIGVLTGFLICAVGLSIYSSKHLTSGVDNKKHDSASETRQVKNVKSPQLRERKSKRID